MGDLIQPKLVTGHGLTSNQLTNIGSGDPLWLAKVATSETISPTFSVDNLDVTDPESLIAFFSVQMTEAKNHLTSLMQEQDGRTKKTQRIQAAVAKLSQWEGGSPTDPAKQKEFLAAADDVLAELPPGSKEAQTIHALVDPIRNSVDCSQTFRAADDGPNGTSAMNQANALRALHEPQGASVTETKDANGQTVYTVNWKEGVPPLTKDQVATITSTAKSYADGLATQSQMGMIRVQQDVEHMSQLNNFLTNILKKRNDAEENVIANLR